MMTSWPDLPGRMVVVDAYALAVALLLRPGFVSAGPRSAGLFVGSLDYARLLETLVSSTRRSRGKVERARLRNYAQVTDGDLSAVLADLSVLEDTVGVAAHVVEMNQGQLGFVARAVADYGVSVRFATAVSIATDHDAPLVFAANRLTEPTEALLADADLEIYALSPQART